MLTNVSIMLSSYETCGGGTREINPIEIVLYKNLCKICKISKIYKNYMFFKSPF